MTSKLQPGAHKVCASMRGARPSRLLWIAGVLLAGMATQAQANLLVNGGFESTNFNGWTAGGNTDFSEVQCTGPGATVSEGTCAAFIGATGSDFTLSQGFATDAGATYLLQFSVLFDGSTPSDFSATINGATVVNFTDPPAGSSFQTFSSYFTTDDSAAGLLSSLSFAGRNDNGFMFVDGVSVSAVPEPSSVALLGLGIGAIALWRRRKPVDAGPAA
jgi:hypothetical protein